MQNPRVSEEFSQLHDNTLSVCRSGGVAGVSMSM